MYVSVVFSIFAEMCSHHHHLLLDYFYDHKRNCMPRSSQLPLSPLNSPLLLLLLWFNRSVLSGSWWPHELQCTRLLSLFHCLPEFAQTRCPLRQWCHSTISSSVAPLSSCPQFFQHPNLFQWVGSSNQVAKILELQRQCFQQIFSVDFL